MAGNASLNRANMAKQDEFYTQLTDIEKELRHYRKHFEGKTVLCNCDDPFESNFFKYFALNFNRLGLKKLIATCYAGSPIANRQLSLFDVSGEKGDAYMAVVTKVYDTTGDGGVDMVDVAALFRSRENTLKRLKGDGDFRSPECVELLDEADIVVTNPPFSLFREYVAMLMEHDKKFVIIGSLNAITYKEVFPLLRDNKIWLGVTSGQREYEVPTLLSVVKNIFERDGKFFAKMGNTCWYTNLDIKKRHEELILVKNYNNEEYPHYDNYNAIEVAKIADIPYDYTGLMGIPITYMTVHNPNQFEIVGISDRDSPLQTKVYTKTDSPKYSDFNRRCTFYQSDGSLKSTYTRILIRNLHPEEAK